MNSFRNLNAYIKAKELVSTVYALIKKFPKEEQYALSDQLRRAVISVPSNIAEGSGRNTTKDQSHFYSMAYASLMEVLAQLDIACDLGYITKEEFEYFEKNQNPIRQKKENLLSILSKGEQRAYFILQFLFDIFKIPGLESSNPFCMK